MGEGGIRHGVWPGPRAEGQQVTWICLGLCYQACLHKLIRVNWLLGKSSSQELCKKDFEVGLQVAKPLFKHTVLHKERLPAPVSLAAPFSTDVNRLKSCWITFTSH